MPSVSKRCVKVCMVSSAARIPFPSLTSFNATLSRSSVIRRSPLERPLPVGDVQRVHAKFVRVARAIPLLVQQSLANTGPSGAQVASPIDRVGGKAETVGLVANGQFQWRVDVALLLVAAHVNIVLSGTAVGEAVYQPRIGVEIEDHRLMLGKQGCELAVRQPVRMLRVRHQLEQIHYIDEPDPELG